VGHRGYRAQDKADHEGEEQVRLARLAIPFALVCTALPARADDESGVLDSRHHRYESPQHFALEFRFAPYKPRVDDAPELHGTPFADSFGDRGVKDSANPRLEIATEFDWQVLRIPHLGTLGPGISVGYVSISRKARIKDCPPFPPPPAQQSCESAEDTNLTIFPMYAVVVLRADVVPRELHIPLVPYVKGGLGFAFWRASNGLGTSEANGVSGKGHTWGTHVAIGLALHLNDFDNAAAVNLDNSVGINHTYAFFELMSAQLTGLGQKEALFVGANTWVVGLAFEM
jgi:hypothetical protein